MSIYNIKNILKIISRLENISDNILSLYSYSFIKFKV